MSLRHRIAHWLHLNLGQVDSWWEPAGTYDRLMIGFRCATCGRLSGVHESLTTKGLRK